jgi:hypothetical protein
MAEGQDFEQGPPAEGGDPLVGQVLAGRYRILAKLGEGAMGAVYLGEHLHIGRRDAIKLLRPGLAGDAEAIARFTRGTRNVSAIRHPNVCAIYDFSDTPEGYRYLAMEYVEGDTLKDILDREGRLEPVRAVEIARQVAEALQAAHEAGVIHRDLKPGNIMICPGRHGQDAVKVVDFDIAKGPAEPEGEEVTRLGFVVGTPEYMSPEQLMGDRLDGRSDLYSLGVVLFRMLSGSLPFRAASTQEIMVQRLTGEPLRLDEVLPPGSLPPRLQQALDRALARRAGDRQANAMEFGREIVAALADVPGASGPGELAATRVAPRPMVGAGTASAQPRTAGGVGRRVPLAALAIAAVLVVAAAGSAMLLLGGDPAEADPIQTQAPVGSAFEPTPADPAADAVPDTVAVAGADPPVAPPRVADRPRLPAGGITTMLDRQILALSGASVSGSALRAIRDSAALGWTLATTRDDSASAALVHAQAALLGNDSDACAQWARRGARLQPSAAFQSLLDACR